MATVNYNPYFNAIERFEDKYFYPMSKQHLNDPNKKTEFPIDFGDGFCSSQFQYYISGTLKKSDGTDYTDGDSIKLIDNFVPFLFTKIEVRKHNKLIDEVEYPGQLSTIKGTISYSKSDVNTSSNGFNSNFSFGRFEAIGKLSHLGLGFFENVNVPIYKGGFNISFIRAEDDDAIYRYKKGNEALPAAGKITIDEFFIIVPIIEFKTTSKIQLVNEIMKSGKVLFHFKQWQCIEQKGISGTTYNFDITNIYRNIYNPKFIIIGFQAARSNNQEKDPSKFDSENIKNIRVKLNGQYYPDELMNLRITDGIYRIAYQRYQEYKSKDVFLTEDEWKNNRPLFVIDTTKVPTNISGSKNDIIINMDFTNLISSAVNVVCYVVVVSEKYLEYDVIKNDIREIK